MSIDAAALVREQLDRLLGQVEDVRAGEDPEAVHRMRVASRRLRTALRLFDVDGPADELRALAAALGRVRDPDVFAEGLRRRATADERPAVEALLAEQAAGYAEARRELLAALDGARFASIEDWQPAEAVGRVRSGLILKPLRALRRSELATRAGRHRARIRAKRLRYAGEMLQVAPDLASLARQIQDALGEAHDAENALDVLLEALSRHPGLARIAAAWRSDGLACLDRFAVLWEQLPRPRDLRRRLEAEVG